MPLDFALEATMSNETRRLLSEVRRLVGAARVEGPERLESDYGGEEWHVTLTRRDGRHVCLLAPTPELALRRALETIEASRRTP